MNKLKKAIDFAYKKHKEQKDDTGEPYIKHLTQVVEILSCVTHDNDILAAAWLHDTIEDTDTTYEDLVQEFGERIAGLVHEVTHEGTKDAGGYYFPRLRSRDAAIIKFADRLSNLSRMESWTKKRQDHYLKKSKFWRATPVGEKK